MSTRELREVDAGQHSRSFVGWGAIFAGGLIGLGTMVLLSSLWLASAEAGATNWIGTNIAWFIGGTAIFSMMIAGFFAGWFSGARGPAQGFVHGLTEWGLITFVAAVIAPGIAGTVALGTGAAPQPLLGTGAMWTLFWSILIGLGSTVLGGLIGGMMPRPVSARVERFRERERRVA